MDKDPLSTEGLKSLIDQAEERDDWYFDIVRAIAILFPKRLLEQLAQLVKNPTWDGDVVSKADRDELIKLGIAVRVCAQGGQGYTAAKYIGWSILKTVQ